MVRRNGNGRSKKLANVSNRELGEALDQNEFVLLFIRSTTCPQCRLVSPMVDKISQKLPIKCVQTNADKHHRLAKKYNVAATPTLILFENGCETQSFEGVPTYEDLEEKILSELGKEGGLN